MDTQVLERGSVEPGELEHLLEAGSLARVDVDERPSRLVYVRQL